MRILVILLFIMITIGKTTSQFPDILFYKGEKISLYSNPLESFFNEGNPKPESLFYDFENYQDSTFDIKISTACWRGYIATWEILDNQLLLIEISDCFEEEKADLEKLFPNLTSEDKVLANWFSGLLVLPFGEIVEYIHMGYASLYEEYKVLEIKNGILTKEKEFTSDEYLKFKKHQFEQFKKTPEYKKQFDELMDDDSTPEEIENFLFIYVIEYTKEFLVD